MTTVLFAPLSFNLAEVTRMIEVARALPDRHDPVFLGYEDDYVDLIRGAGFEYRECAPALTASQREQALRFDQSKTLWSPFTRALVGARVRAERSVIRDTGARAVVIGTNPTSIVSARAEGVPLFYAVPFALTGPHVAQTGRLGLVPGQGRLSRGIDRVATGAFRWVYDTAPLAPRAFAHVARDNGIAPLRTVASLLEADHNLLTVMPWELDGYRLPDGYTRVGPMFARLDVPLPDIVTELAGRDEPLVYLGLGSSASRRVALGAARDLGAAPVNVVAPIRHYLRPGDEVPDNVHVTDLLPAHLLGGLVDAAVLHGGQGTVQTSCMTGIPFVGMGMQPEQRWNVRVCVAQGNALALPPRRAGTGAVAHAVHRLLTEPSFRESARRLRAVFEGEDGAVASAGIIDEVLRARVDSP